MRPTVGDLFPELLGLVVVGGLALMWLNTLVTGSEATNQRGNTRGQRRTRWKGWLMVGVTVGPLIACQIWAYIDGWSSL